MWSKRIHLFVISIELVRSRKRRNDHAKQFGGSWTVIKLHVLQQYLNAYLNVMKNQPFDLVYIDAFAGSGQVEIMEGRLIDGSTKIALDTKGFDHYVFVEQDMGHVRELQSVCKPYEKDFDIHILPGNANNVLLSQVARYPWNVRGVAFLDPYGMELQWETLQALAQTKKLDIWYLFPLSGLYRQATKDPLHIDPVKRAAVDRLLGTTEWYDAIYHHSRQPALFPELERPERADVDGLERYVKKRLETVFARVGEPLRLPKDGPPRYSLFFGVSNPNPSAGKIATEIARHILSHA